MKLAFEYTKLIVKKNMQYKLNFFLLCLTVAPIHLVQLFFSWVITDQFGVVDGWRFTDLAFLYGLMLTSYSIAQILFRQFRFLDNFIIQGSLDSFLVKPQSVLYTMVFSHINIMEILSQLLPSVVVLVIATIKLEVAWNIGRVVVFAGGIVGGSIIMASIFVITGATAFWTQKLGQFVSVFFAFKDYLNYPVTIYSKPIIFFLTFLLPLAFVNYYPAAYILGKTNHITGFLTFPVSLLMGLIAIGIWKTGLSRYSSTGS